MGMSKPLSRIGITSLGNYEYLRGRTGSIKLKEVCKRIIDTGSVVVMDLETNGKDPLMSDILLVSFSYNGSTAYVFNPNEISIEPFLEVLRKNPIANHFMKFDYKYIKCKYGIDMNVHWDTGIAHGIATAGISMLLGGNGLDNLASRYLGVTLDKSTRTDFLKGTWKTDKHIRYAAEDALATYQLINITRALLEAAELLHIWELEKPLISILSNMELRGVNLNISAALDLRDKYQREVDSILLEIQRLTEYDETVYITCTECNNRGKKKLTCVNCGAAGKVPVVRKSFINPGSPKQIIDYFLSNNVEVPTKDRKPTKTRQQTVSTPSVDGESLKKINHPFARLLEKYRDYSHQLSSFLIPWTTPCDTNEDGKFNPLTGCIHPEITQVDTTTGRNSYKNPKINWALV